MSLEQRRHPVVVSKWCGRSINRLDVLEGNLLLVWLRCRPTWLSSFHNLVHQLEYIAELMDLEEQLAPLFALR